MEWICNAELALWLHDSGKAFQVEVYRWDAQRKAGIHAQALQSIERALQFPNPYPSREVLLRWKKELDAANRKS
ncbi:hypothetical protein [Brevibacillus porteri]|uniref:hypothetical protein n=1 Tax=Brevibacillus porteri TaxID=2126350 RepID=UPI003D259375